MADQSPSFTVSRDDVALIGAIADRAAKLAKSFGMSPPDRLSTVMDLMAAHGNNGNWPLKLQELLDGSNTDFIHDVWGIWGHMDRKTGRLGGFFLPRYAATNASATTSA